MRTNPPTVAEMEALTDEEKLAMVKQAKTGEWYDGWRPYCLQCSTVSRMLERPYGFQCGSCHNMISFDLYRLVESPLNKK